MKVYIWTTRSWPFKLHLYNSKPLFLNRNDHNTAIISVLHLEYDWKWLSFVIASFTSDPWLYENLMSTSFVPRWEKLTPITPAASHSEAPGWCWATLAPASCTRPPTSRGLSAEAFQGFGVDRRNVTYQLSPQLLPAQRCNTDKYGWVSTKWPSNASTFTLWTGGACWAKLKGSAVMFFHGSAGGGELKRVRLNPGWTLLRDHWMERREEREGKDRKGRRE